MLCGRAQKGEEQSWNRQTASGLADAKRPRVLTDTPLDVYCVRCGMYLKYHL